jgi:hypothetical protein
LERTNGGGGNTGATKKHAEEEKGERFTRFNEFGYNGKVILRVSLETRKYISPGKQELNYHFLGIIILDKLEKYDKKKKV